jgi:hypothetical protein
MKVENFTTYFFSKPYNTINEWLVGKEPEMLFEHYDHNLALKRLVDVYDKIQTISKLMPKPSVTISTSDWRRKARHILVNLDAARIDDEYHGLAKENFYILNGIFFGFQTAHRQTICGDFVAINELYLSSKFYGAVYIVPSENWKKSHNGIFDNAVLDLKFCRQTLSKLQKTITCPILCVEV